MLLIALAVVALGLASRFLLAPWVVKLHYVRLVSAAAEIVIRPHGGTDPGITIRRSDHADAFARVETAVRNGYVRPYQCQCIPAWELDVTTASGTHTDGIRVCHYLDSPRQPLRGRFWFYPRLYLAGDPDLPDEIERIYRSAGPTPSGDGPRSEARAESD